MLRHRPCKSGQPVMSGKPTRRKVKKERMEWERGVEVEKRQEQSRSELFC